MHKSKKRKRALEDDDAKEIDPTLSYNFTRALERIFDTTRPAFTVRVEDDDHKVRGFYNFKKNPLHLLVFSGNKMLYERNAKTGLWRSLDTKLNFDDQELLQNLTALDSKTPINLAAEYNIRNDAFFDADEKLYYQENFVKRRDPDFDNPNRYMNFAVWNDLSIDFEVSKVDVGKRTESQRFILYYNLR